jgi:protein-S-isoprenylcysteine O-methyltransferase Ste14
MEPHLLVRAASVYIAVVLTAAACMWRRPRARDVTAAGLGFAWNVPIVLALHLVAARWGWWRFEAEGGVLLGMPVDLWLVWAWLWGAVPLLACPSVNLIALVAMAFAIDLVLMPAASPVLQLGPSWLVGEGIALATAFVPGQYLARWTVRDEHLVRRALLQMIAFTGLLVFIVPAIAIEGSASGWVNPIDRPLWQISVFAHLLAIPAVLGMSAVQEFVQRGGGTPVPFDPPRRLVTTGVYAYVRNPMQLSAVLLLVLLGVALGNLWIGAAGLMAHLYSAGLAGWDEDEDLRRRLGEGWTAYRRTVRAWLPRTRPSICDARGARLFVASECGMCQEVARWFAQRHPRGLIIVPAESHPSAALSRITYEASDGLSVSGIEAIARALEHIHLGWAFLAFVLRMPIITPLVQLIVDASGGAPRRITRACDT